MAGSGCPKHRLVNDTVSQGFVNDHRDAVLKRQCHVCSRKRVCLVVLGLMAL